MAEFYEEDTQAIVRGVKYTAVETKDGKCGLCAFKKGFGCELAEDVLRHRPELVHQVRVDLTHCRAESRSDGKGVIWVNSSLVKVVPA